MPLPDEFHELARAVNNWGRWGSEDELGTLNLVTDDVVRRAAAYVRAGRRFGLALPLSEEGPQTGLIPGRVNPTRTMLAVNEPLTGDPAIFCSSDDAVTMGLQAATHWDALAHVSYDGRLWNGFPIDVVTETGASRCGIDNVRELVSRGVLLDVARALGRERLEAGYGITPDDLDAAADLAQVDVSAGDIVLVRTGQVQLLPDDRMGYAYPSPGLTMATARWFHERDVAAVAIDNLTLDVWPGEHGDVVLPVHLLHLVEMGMTQGQNWDLEELAADCADDGEYAFLVSATPEPFVHALGAPVAPVAVK